MLADILLRRRPYADADLFAPAGRYGVIRWVPVGLMVVGSVIGFGLVVNTYASWLTWQGYLLGPFGLGGKTGTWEYANLGVIVALVVAAIWTGVPFLRWRTTTYELTDRRLRLRKGILSRTGRDFPIIVIQEAGLDGFWIHRVLQSEGIESYVVDAASILTSRRRRRRAQTCASS